MTFVQTIETRLNKLPTKVASPFRQLYEAGHLNNEQISTVLDAGELAREHSRLLGFAIAYLSQQSRGVPVKDVIQMAKNQQRRINLDWSAKRWKLEHDKLSRSEALERLSKENVIYDVSKFEEHLPDKFCGYVIRTSRRLGMEGLRQRHCVASYHTQIISGNCGIAVVFIDKKRWTVQLSLTNNPDRPLHISQIKSKHNDLPSAKTKDAIYDRLGIDLSQQLRNPAIRNEHAKSYFENLRLLLPLLNQNRVEQVTVYFDGYSDNGYVDSITYEIPSYVENRADFDGKVINVAYLAVSNSFQNGQLISETQRTIGTLDEAMEQLTYDYLEDINIDWYNDDGGYGKLKVDVRDETVSLEVNVRYTDTTCEYSGKYDIGTGDPID